MTTYQRESFPIPTPWRLVRELRLRRPPWWMVATLILVVIATWIPLTLIYQARQTKSRQPRIHFFQDMDKQAKFGPQASHAWFLDGRSMRLPVEGTIARGRLMHDQPFFLGYLTEDGTLSGKVTEFTKSLPPQLSEPRESLVVRGQERYAIYCDVPWNTRGRRWSSQPEGHQTQRSQVGSGHESDDANGTRSCGWAVVSSDHRRSAQHAKLWSTNTTSRSMGDRRLHAKTAD